MKNILLAEDDRISRIMLQAVLRKWGYDVIAVSDGRDALEALLRPEGPSLAILDWMMPGMTGVEVCRRIKAQEGFRPIHLMLLTSRAKGIEAAESLAAGADDHLAKPYNLPELKARIELGMRRLRLASGAGSVADSTGGSRSGLELVDGNCQNAMVTLNRIALRAALEEPGILFAPAVVAGVCDLDETVRQILSRSERLLAARLECVWGGEPLRLDVSSASVEQILVNLLAFFREQGDETPCRLRMTSRREAIHAVVEIDASAPDASQTALDRLATMPMPGCEGGLSGFGPCLARWAAEAAGGSLQFVSNPAGGVSVQLRLPLAD